MLAVIPLSESVTAHSCLCEHNQQMAHTDRFPSPRSPKTKSNSWLLGCTQRLWLKLIRRSELTGNETNCRPPSVAPLPLFFLLLFFMTMGQNVFKGGPEAGWMCVWPFCGKHDTHPSCRICGGKKKKAALWHRDQEVSRQWWCAVAVGDLSVEDTGSAAVTSLLQFPLCSR